MTTAIAEEARYAVTIPTFGLERVSTLKRTIDAFRHQTMPPELIVVINNNEEPLPLDRADDLLITRNDYYTPGIIHGDQTGLRIVSEREFTIAARWDDDLIPRPGCMERLFRSVNHMAVAAGGMYPSAQKPGRCSYFSKDGKPYLFVPDGNPRHLQFFEWEGEPKLWVRRFLYSSFMYRVESAQKVGGFCTEYSQHSFRADTDFTLRIGKVGMLVVDTQAVADHLFGDGGTRAIIGDTKKRMLELDLRLFDLRMRTLGIDPNY